MLEQCFRFVTLVMVKYQRIFFTFIFLTLVSCYLLEKSYGRKRVLPHKFHPKKPSSVVKSSRDIKSTLVDEAEDSLLDQPINNGELDKLSNKSDIAGTPDDVKSLQVDSLDLDSKPLTARNSALHQDRKLQADSLEKHHTSPHHKTDIEKHTKDTNENELDQLHHWLPSYEQKHALSMKHATHPMDFERDDVLVFMHIPKTSGKTFNSHLVQDMKVPHNITCDCKTLEKPHGCKCLNSEGHMWLFSRLSTAWPCGVHPSWSDLSRDCLNHAMDRKEKLNRKRKFTIVTVLRSPYTRYISEWHNVQQDGQWKPFQSLRCYPLSKENFCYEDNWVGVTLDQFLNCPTNPANNRQVRMLADLHMANCSEVFEWLTIPESVGNDVDDAEARYQYILKNPLLMSAMHNLKHLPFFGLEEYQRESEYLFTRTFGYPFRKHFKQSKTFAEQVTITEKQRQKILDLNRLDLVFYKYAKELFFKRLHENVKRKHVFLTDIVDSEHVSMDGGHEVT